MPRSNTELLATMLMNSNGQMRRSACSVYWHSLLGYEITEYEVRHMICLPKSSFHDDYVPHEVPPAENAGTSLFGQSDTEPEEDANTPTAE